MLRVLTLSTLFPDRSRPNFGVFVERQTLGLAAMADVAVRVVAPIGLPPGPLALIQHAERLTLPLMEMWQGTPVYRPRFTAIPGVGGRWHAHHLLRALEPLCDSMYAEWPFDVIDASFFYPDGPAAIMLGERYGVPVSIKARGADIHHWGTMGPTAPQVLAAARAADGMLAVSAAMRADMVALGMPADRIRVHHSGVDLARFRPCDRAAAKAAMGIAGPVILSLGALIPRKGHHLVVDAVARLPSVTLLIAGEGAGRSALMAQVVERGMADRVRLLGAVPHARMPDILGAADVMALASASEGLANAWLEALACGTPIVISAAGGAREVVTTAAAGRIAMCDPQAFAVAIAEVLADRPDPAAVRATVSGFTWDANSAALADHLSGLAARGRRPARAALQASSG